MKLSQNTITVEQMTNPKTGRFYTPPSQDHRDGGSAQHRHGRRQPMSRSSTFATQAAAWRKPVRELKGFQRVTLDPGEVKQVSFTLGFEELSYYNLEMTRVDRTNAVSGVDRRQFRGQPGRRI